MRCAAFSTVSGLLVAVSVIGGGCGVQQDRYDSLLQTERSLREENIRLNDELTAAQGNLESMSQELAQARSQVRMLQASNTDLGGQVDAVTSDYDSLLTRVRSLEMGPLPPDVEMDLKRLSEEYAQLLSFDARQGMLRFASDFTFALGSAELNQDAMSTMSILADVLNKDSAADLEVHVIGHTDNVPIGKPETRQKHPTNLHLSVHRAIAVQQALADQGVDAVRIQVAGYGEHRPLVPNGPRGAQANRRVEIFLLPMPTDMAERARSYRPEVSVDPNEPMK